MLRLTNYTDSSGSFTLEMITPSDFVNSISLSAATPATDTIPAGAKFIAVNATATLYMRIGAAAAVPGTVTDGSASELIVSSTSGFPVFRTLPVIASAGSLASGSTALVVSPLQGFATPTLTGTEGFTKNDGITIKGAGVAGADLVTTITAINPATGAITLAGAASTTVVNASVLKTYTTIGFVSPSTCIVTISYYK